MKSASVASLLLNVKGAKTGLSSSPSARRQMRIPNSKFTNTPAINPASSPLLLFSIGEIFPAADHECKNY